MTCHHPRAQGLSGSAEHIALLHNIITLNVEMQNPAVLINWSCCGDAGPLPLPPPGEQCIDKMIISVHNIHTDQPSSGKATKLIWIVFQISNYELNRHQTERSSRIQTVIDLKQTFHGHAISQYCYNQNQIHTFTNVQRMCKYIDKKIDVKVKKVVEGQYFHYSPAVDYVHVLGRPRAVW